MIIDNTSNEDMFQDARLDDALNDFIKIANAIFAEREPYKFYDFKTIKDIQFMKNGIWIQCDAKGGHDAI